MNEKKTINRRQALKTLAAVTGAVSLASLPAWEKPVIEVGALPAHAQSSMATIRVTNHDIRSIPVSIIQLNAGTTAQVNSGSTLIAGPVTIAGGDTYDFIVPPLSLTNCDDGYFADADCSNVNSQGVQIGFCVAAGEVVPIQVDCGF